MGIFNLDSKTGDAAINLPHYHGVPNFPENWPSELILHDDVNQLEIRPRTNFGGGKESVFLPYLKITGVLLTTEKEIKEQGKSVLGRAALGGILLGPLGAVVGGISGTGKKQNVKYQMALIINYKSNPEDEDVKVISFINNTFGNAKKFADMLKTRAKIVDVVVPTGPITL